MSDFGIIESDERRICYREETRHGGRRYTIQLFNLESSTSIVAIGPTSTYTLDVCGKKKDSSGRSLLIEEVSRCFLEGLFLVRRLVGVTPDQPQNEHHEL